MRHFRIAIMNEILDINFVEADIFEKEKISFHIPHSKKLDENHKYFNKRIVWTLIEWKDTEDYPYNEIKENKKNGIRFHEIPEQIVSEINGITSESIKDKINFRDCFAFDFKPSEFNKLILRSDYEFQEIKAVTQPYSRIFKYIALTYKNGGWVIDEKVEKRVVCKSRTGIVKIKFKNK